MRCFKIKSSSFTMLPLSSFLLLSTFESFMSRDNQFSRWQCMILCPPPFFKYIHTQLERKIESSTPGACLGEERCLQILIKLCEWDVDQDS